MINLLRLILSDLNAGTRQSPARILWKFLFNMSFRLILNYRIGNYLHHHRGIVTNILIKWLKTRQIKNFASDISYHCTIGRGVKFPHPLGIVIGVDSKVGHNVTIWQNVTLGSSGVNRKDYPIIESNVKLFANCQIIGGVVVGQGSNIGASSVVVSDIPANVTAVGIPAKII